MYNKSLFKVRQVWLHFILIFSLTVNRTLFTVILMDINKLISKPYLHYLAKFVLHQSTVNNIKTFL